jgi:SlyX protein
MESRLEKMETKISQNEDLLDALNNTVYKQQRQIDQLQQELRELRQQVQTMPSEPRSLGDEIPPHY